jgi:2-keto-4-pentenoate hydratase/2-oxohepta-3-ene-1,7-dioic acid hydratase in catechol pathway
MHAYSIQGSSQRLSVGKIIGLARTYRAHAEEMHAKVTEEPLLFLKPESAVIYSGESVVIPALSKCLHHEVELGVVIGRDGSCIPEARARDCVLGYLVCLDITARDLQAEAKKNGWPWAIAKGFDTFAPISDVVPKERVVDPMDLDLSLQVNGQVRQQANTRLLLYSLDHIVAFVSSVMSLRAGDLIMTGTPEGVGELKEGDRLDARLGEYCSLHVDVRSRVFK